MHKNRHMSTWALPFSYFASRKVDNFFSYFLDAERLLKVPHQQGVLVGVQPPPEPIHVDLPSAKSDSTSKCGLTSDTVKKQSLIDETTTHNSDKMDERGVYCFSIAQACVLSKETLGQRGARCRCVNNLAAHECSSSQVEGEREISSTFVSVASDSLGRARYH